MLAVIADTHLPRGGRALPPECVERLRTADLILHAGDFTDASFLAELEAIGPPVRGVHGNVDEHELRVRLPAALMVTTARARIAMVHDAGARDGRLARLRARFPDADAVVFGHSHLPLHERDESSGFQIFNPGSPTARRRAPTHSMGIARIDEDGRLRFELVDLGR